MEDNKKDKLNEIDQLLKETSAENRLKFGTIEPEEDSVRDESIDILSESIEPEEAETEAAETVLPESTQSSEEAPSEGGICIIDETSTTIELTESVDFYGEADGKKVKKPKEKVKFNVGQIILMCVFGVALLWCVMFTTDHTLASFGRAPIFSKEVQTYEDGSASFKGLGYKIQFSFDANSNLTQKCVPFWEAGPNDLIDQGGASFE